MFPNSNEVSNIHGASDIFYVIKMTLFRMHVSNLNGAVFCLVTSSDVYTVGVVKFCVNRSYKLSQYN